MAGRCISVTHEALGTVRVMKTCGMMGEVVGKAAAICVENSCGPRRVYEDYLATLEGLLELPGKARREQVGGPVSVPDDALPKAGPHGPPSGIDPGELPGIVVDDRKAEAVGPWSEGTGLQGYVGWGYRYAAAESGARLLYEITAPAAGRYTVRASYLPHENRGPSVPVVVETAGFEEATRINMREAAPADGWYPLATVQLQAGQVVRVQIGTEGAGGYAHADAVQLLKE